ncbi:FAD-dependent monooxygenase [Kaarinaea lacus]
MTDNLQKFDVIINGGGMVGLLLANALATHKLSIVIIETGTQKPAWNNSQFDQRVSAITRASQQIFETLGVWQDIAAMRISPFREMHVWDSTGDGVIHFDSADIGQDCLGHIIENSVIQLALHQRLQSFDNVYCFQPASPSELQMDEQQVNLTLDNEANITAKLLVGADGGQSWVRHQAGIAVRTIDYKQNAVSPL